MYPFHQQVLIRLQFRSMTEPVTVSVPGNVLIYLDTHAERTFAPDGSIIYHQPEPKTQENKLLMPRS